MLILLFEVENKNWYPLLLPKTPHSLLPTSRPNNLYNLKTFPPKSVSNDLINIKALDFKHAKIRCLQRDNQINISV